METKSYKDMTPEEKEKFLKKAKNTGIATAITGLSTVGMGFLGDYFNNDPKRQDYSKKRKYKIAGKGKRIAKVVGTGATLTGAGLYGVAKYKHHKLKKNEDSKKD